MYLKPDVLLLCDDFEKFISVCLKDYGLDPSHDISSPGLSWDSMLNMTGIQLEKVHDIDVHLFLEKGMRGGISYISRRYSKSDDNTTILYLDANNLYGWAMIQDLSISNFKFLPQKEVNNFNLDSISENFLISYVLECDLKYLKNYMIYRVIILYDLRKLILVLICCLIIVLILQINME